MAATSGRIFAALTVVAMSCARICGQAACTPAFGPEFAPSTVVAGAVQSQLVFDDGTGPALFIGGNFNAINSMAVGNIAKWTGSVWSPLSTGANNQVRALAGFDPDGTGPAPPELYAGGVFNIVGGQYMSHVARWNGAAWLPTVPNALGNVNALAVFDPDGNGPAPAALYAGTENGVPSQLVTKWDGSTWSAAGGGTNTNAVVASLLAFDPDGAGPAPASLYAAGGFSSMNGVSTLNVARFDGTSWFALGGGVTGYVAALASYDDGTGPALYAGGSFTQAGGVAVNGIARWNGTSWSPVGPVLPGQVSVSALAVHDDGTGPALYAGGMFAGMGVAKWNGSFWSAVGAGLPSGAGSFSVFDDGAGAKLYAAANLSGVGPGNGLVRWSGSNWEPLGAGGPNGPVRACRSFDAGTGPSLFAGGDFTAAGGITATNVARWNGAAWSDVGGGMNGSVVALVDGDAGSGPSLFAGGYFTSVGSVLANRVARWDGSSWSPLGSGMNDTVFALAFFDDGTGPALHAGGAFTTAGALAANHVAKWNGSAWVPLGSGLDQTVRALGVFDDGSGPALYAGGSFTTAGGVTASHLAKWNGAAWSPLGPGTNNVVLGFAPFDDGTGPALFLCGQFTTAGGLPAGRIAKWNGSALTPFGVGTDGTVSALLPFDDGGGPALYAGGFFTAAGGVSANRIARWRAGAWTTPGSGADNWVQTLALFSDTAGPAVYAGGGFLTAGGAPRSYLAKWQTAGPLIGMQPVSRTVAPGASVQLHASAFGAGPLAYQWRRNAVALPGATSATYAIASFTAADAGTYDVIVTGPCGMTTSAPATLALADVVLGITQPQGPGSIAVTLTSGPAGASYFTALTFDPANATSPGTGAWGGLHISIGQILVEYGLAAPPFVGVLDGAGQSVFAAPPGTIGPPLIGMTVHGVTRLYDPTTLTLTGLSNLASRMLQ